MTRDIESAAQTASQASSGYHHIYMAAIDYPDGTVRVHTGIGDIAFGGFTYLGVGRLGSISTVEETAELRATKVELALAGIPGDLISTALGQNYKGRKAIVYSAFIDSSWSLVDDPIKVFEGILDVMPIKIGREATVRQVVESRLADWDRPRVRRYTNEDQQSRYPGDLGLEFVSQTVEKELVWGVG